MGTTVKYGFVKPGFDGLVKGLYMGPAGGKVGVVRKLAGGKYNLLGGTIIFQASGKQALGAITSKMLDMKYTYVRFGARGPYLQECFDGGADQAVEGGPEPMEYYIYLSEWSNETPFTQALTTVVGTVGTFAGAAALGSLSPPEGLAETIRQATEATLGVIDVADKAHRLSESDLTLLKLMKSEKVKLTITPRMHNTDNMLLVAVHKHTHRVSTLVKDIEKMVNDLLAKRGGKVSI